MVDNRYYPSFDGVNQEFIIAGNQTKTLELAKRLEQPLVHFASLPDHIKNRGKFFSQKLYEVDPSFVLEDFENAFSLVNHLDGWDK